TSSRYWAKSFSKSVLTLSARSNLKPATSNVLKLLTSSVIRRGAPGDLKRNQKINNTTSGQPRRTTVLPNPANTVAATLSSPVVGSSRLRNALSLDTVSFRVLKFEEFSLLHWVWRVFRLTTTLFRSSKACFRVSGLALAESVTI